MTGTGKNTPFPQMYNGKVYKYIVMENAANPENTTMIMFTSVLMEALKKALEYDFNIYEYERPNRLYWRNPWVQ